MKKAKVFFVPCSGDAAAKRALPKLLDAAAFSKVMPKNDFIAVKTHFGEKNSVTHIPPSFFPEIAKRIKQLGSTPFLTETSTLYKGNRSDAIVHNQHGLNHGFTLKTTGMTIQMADGLKGDWEYEVALPNGTKVMIAGMLKKLHGLVCTSHPTGHIALGFGGTIKNLGMGLSSRKGKLIQHSSVNPSVNTSECTGCGRCVQWCPVDAITMQGKKASIAPKKCIGCGECLTECRFDAIVYNWEADKTRIQKTTAEHAMGAVLGKKCFYINYLLHFTKDCDCFGTAKKPLIKDIGLLASWDPVAVDAATIDLIEERAGCSLQSLAYEELDPRIQIHHGAAIGLGTSQYTLVECA